MLTPPSGGIEPTFFSVPHTACLHHDILALHHLIHRKPGTADSVVELHATNELLCDGLNYSTEFWKEKEDQYECLKHKRNGKKGGSACAPASFNANQAVKLGGHVQAGGLQIGARSHDRNGTMC